jgi:hypothetical protein
MTTTEFEVVELDEIVPFEEPTDADQKAHVVNPPLNTHIWKPGITSQDMVDLARTYGIELVALCGHRFVPKHNPDKLDACETCMKIAGELMRENGE